MQAQTRDLDLLWLPFTQGKAESSRDPGVPLCSPQSPCPHLSVSYWHTLPQSQWVDRCLVPRFPTQAFALAIPSYHYYIFLEQTFCR